MNITGVILAAAIVGIVGLLIGVLLGIASEKFKVETDERETLIREELPGNNCGGCGYPGCDGLAAAIVQGTAPVNGCPVGGAAVAEKIAAIMGVENTVSEKQVAFVKCKGTCDKVRVKYRYDGIRDCRDASVVPGKGEKACSYGCLGYGSCVSVCAFDAIHIVDGVAVVDKEACVACGKCAAVCPNHLIELVPYKAEHLVQCSSHDKGKVVRAVCDAGCIGCTLCTKKCPSGAIHMEHDLAVIDYDACTNCGLCAQSCPVHAIL